MSVTRRYYVNDVPASAAEVRYALEPSRLDEALAALLGHRVSEGGCPHCSTTEADIERTGLVGCSLCYAVHENYLLQRFGVSVNG